MPVSGYLFTDRRHGFGCGAVTDTRFDFTTTRRPAVVHNRTKLPGGSERNVRNSYDIEVHRRPQRISSDALDGVADGPIPLVGYDYAEFHAIRRVLHDLESYYRREILQHVGEEHAGDSPSVRRGNDVHPSSGDASEQRQAASAFT